MELENQKSRYKRLCNWFTTKQKENKPSNSLYEIKDGKEDESDDYGGNLSLQSLEIDPCISTNKLRIFVGTWNVAGRSPVGSLAVDLDEWLNLKNSADIYVLGFQEIVPLKTSTVIGAEDTAVAASWNELIGRTLNNKFGCPWLTPMLNSSLSSDEMENLNIKYRLVASKKMVGVFISVWLKEEYRVSNVKVCSVACGVMGCLGNKGCVAVSMLIEGTSFCFVAAHLASGEKKGDEGRRNHQVAEIFRRTTFPRTTKHHHPLTISSHECDRILWYGKGVEQLHYIRSERKFSDHRPVSALFSTQIEIKSSSRGLVELHNIPPTMLHPNHGVCKAEEDGKSTSLSLLMKNVQGC